MSKAISVADIISPVLGVVDHTPADATELAETAGRCRHAKIRVAREDRTVSCGQCGKKLDPFDLLLQYAKGERRWQHFAKLVREAETKLTEIKDEERKTKARLKNASRKEASTAVAAEQTRTERMRIEITETARDIVEKCRRIEQLARRRTT